MLIIIKKIACSGANNGRRDCKFYFAQLNGVIKAPLIFAKPDYAVTCVTD